MKKCLQCRRNTARRDSLYCGKCEAVISDAVEQQSLLEAVRQMRDETGDGMMTCKRRLEKKALRQILCQSSCDPGIRFILTKLIEDMNP